MLTVTELKTMGHIPKQNYKMGQGFPKDFQRPLFVVNSVFKKLPLYIQVGYETEMVNGTHKLKEYK